MHLLSRSGEPGLSTGRIGRWARAEPRLSVHAVDGTDRAAMEAFLQALAQQAQRVGGVVHAAMVLRDRLIRDPDLVEARQVVDAKLAVGQVLAGLLRGGQMAPDHVLVSSSIAAYLGNPGQVSYSTANCAIAQLARQLRDQGHPVRTLGWGAISDAGCLTRNAAVALQLSKMDGVGFLSSHDLVAELGTALRAPRIDDHVLAPIQWARLDWPVALALVPAELRTILAGHHAPAARSVRPEPPLQPLWHRFADGD